MAMWQYFNSTVCKCVNITVVGLSLVPGLRKRGLLQPVTQKLSGILGGLGVSKSKGD